MSALTNTTNAPTNNSNTLEQIKKDIDKIKEDIEFYSNILEQTMTSVINQQKNPIHIPDQKYIDIQSQILEWPTIWHIYKKWIVLFPNDDYRYSVKLHEFSKNNKLFRFEFLDSDLKGKITKWFYISEIRFIDEF